jgi:hypothetical protein
MISLEGSQLKIKRSPGAYLDQARRRLLDKLQ